MTSQKQILFSLILFEFCFFLLITSTIVLQDANIRNPITDIVPETGANPYSIAGGTADSLGDTVTPQQQTVQSCGVFGIIGGGIGLVGFLAGPVGILTTAGGFVAGCAIGGILFPQQGSQLYQQTVSSLGPVGDFVKAVVLVLSYIGPVINFASDTIKFESALLDPKNGALFIGAFLMPIQAMTTIWVFAEMAAYFRGIGIFG